MSGNDKAHTDNPKAKSAVALKHHDGDKKNAPQVVAKGFGELAEEIITLAKESGVLIHEDPYLSEFLASLDLGQEIPEQLYHVIAELISFSYVLQGKFPESWAKDYNKVSKLV
ncbi:EscU/YscU/HrcU family type III secretion system export apparatus switch protein [Paraglaciecola sp. 20A4]|uniref:EscU/YscU/HrcU family type III secretion system export apparatus switch protein n=1 Tax=Paraglaciecola sp. 20A4 TaxID=2687288 RepID=UPI00140D60F6|nr:EscU/YscU/HrcU family type III secretion system export apparatus switch protein [Paraglaciecola sp. 20A4]